MKQQPLHPLVIILAVLGFCSFFLINILSVSNMELETTEVGSVITKDAASEAAIQYIQELHQTTALDSFVTYQTQKKLSGYLNKNDLAPSYNRTFAENYPLDYFQVEINDAAGGEYLVYIHMTSGEVLGWIDLPLKEKKYTNYEMDIARSYLEKNSLSPADFKVNEPDNSTSHLTFENKNKQVGESYLQLHLSVRDDKVTSFQYSFHIPASHLAWLDDQDGSALTMSLLSLGISLLMAFIAVFFMIKYRKQMSFRRGLFLTLVFLAANMIHNINMYPGLRAISAGQSGNDAFIVINILLSSLITIVMAIVVYLSFVTGDGLWRRENRNVWPRWKEASFGHYVVRAMGIGYLFCLIIIGFQRIMFYLGEQYFGVWSVNDPLQSIHNIWVPMLFPLLAWVAAISEEAIYRLFGIIIFKKLVKNTFIAVLIPSMIWAMGHTQYPIYPAYTRFIEVTILGLIFGYIFLKHGLITAIFAHTSVNSILMGLSLFGISGGAAHNLAGLFYMASPAIIAYIIYLLHSRFRKDDSPPLDSQGVLDLRPEAPK